MLKQKIHNIIEKGAHGSKGNLVFDYFIMSLIILNIVALIIETIPHISLKIQLYLRVFEIFSIVIFTIEYLLRIYIADLIYPNSKFLFSKIKFASSVYGIIDLLAILPFYLPLIFPFDLRFIRILRLLRFLRILKIGRYNNSLSLIITVVKEKKTELFLTGFIAFLIILIASFLMFYAEHEAQPQKFPDILSCFWYAIATLTTVGYGDIYPITRVGQFLSGLIAIMGIGIVALPTGIISSGFINKLKKEKKHTVNPKTNKCPHCGKDLE